MKKKIRSTSAEIKANGKLRNVVLRKICKKKGGETVKAV